MSTRKVSRAQCANCTCSPGLLSRNNRRSSWLHKQINIKRTNSGNISPRGASRQGSVFTIDAASLCLPEVKEVNTSQRLVKLRNAMAEHNLGVYIIPSEDQHQSEYVSSADQRRSFISGFQGSAGVAVVTRDVMCMNDTPEGAAALSTDGRYFNQATNELDFNWILLKQGAKDEPTWEEWAVLQAIQLSLDSGSEISIGVDPKLITLTTFEKFDKIIRDKLSLTKYSKAEVSFIPVQENLVDKIWSQFEELPPLPANIIKPLDIKFHGNDVSNKIASVVEELNSKNASGLIISALDEIAWLLNLRGSDIEFNPVFYSYLILTNEGEVTLYADHTRFDTTVSKLLRDNNIKVEPYNSFWKGLKEISSRFKDQKKKLLLPKTVSWEIVRNVKCSYEQGRSTVEDLKSIKNQVELEGAKSAHLKDGRALIKFFSWLENELINNNELIDEIEADDKLTEFRKQEKNFVGLSFTTISSTGANAAVIHYKPIKGDCAVINPDKIYLNDSGSQFLEGTTDTTRTVHFGTPTSEQIKNYTLVLKGNISLGALKFPENTTGALIDSIARQHLWSEYLDYGHGTSHGIGSYLNVHEGPIGIGPRPNAATSFLKPGHLLSNEPGYYENGEYGIRIENVMFVKETGRSYGGRNFLEFETVTRVPLCKKLIDVNLLTPQERKWINEYHATIWKEIAPTLESNSIELRWLKRETTPL
ncbi:putative Xaa-Pro aminopeptidase Fra1p [[Candida] anglica]|uniref:Xaa-Pro aminopeptidase Fra1p n=1 Tax=[Candida] anglica TaxID=148631 RepID=A0ABP0EA72_9ASCO